MSATNNYFLHPSAICESNHIGKGTRIWAFAHVLPEARVGEDCNICDGVFIENEVIVGDRVTVKSGVQLWDGVTLEDDVFVGPNVTFTNDKFPRSKQSPQTRPATIVEKGASIGANATILPGLRIGSLAMIGAGCVVTRDAPPSAILVGNPGRIVGYVGSDVRKLSSSANTDKQNIGLTEDLKIPGCQLWRLPHFSDARGDIGVIDFDHHLPFQIKRIFYVHSVKSERVRGAHAHKQCSQILVAINGDVSIILDNGEKRQQIELNDRHVGVLVPSRIWSVQCKFSPDAVLLVLASDHYDPEDYIRKYEEFLAFVQAG